MEDEFSQKIRRYSPIDKIDSLDLATEEEGRMCSSEEGNRSCAISYRSAGQYRWN